MCVHPVSAAQGAVISLEIIWLVHMNKGYISHWVRHTSFLLTLLKHVIVIFEKGLFPSTPLL